jgi:hypothetical protein
MAEEIGVRCGVCYGVCWPRARVSMESFSRAVESAVSGQRRSRPSCCCRFRTERVPPADHNGRARTSEIAYRPGVEGSQCLGLGEKKSELEEGPVVQAPHGGDTEASPWRAWCDPDQWAPRASDRGNIEKERELSGPRGMRCGDGPEARVAA